MIFRNSSSAGTHFCLWSELVSSTYGWCCRRLEIPDIGLIPARFYRSSNWYHFSLNYMLHTRICKYHIRDQYRVSRSTRCLVFSRKTLMMAGNSIGCPKSRILVLSKDQSSPLLGPGMLLALSCILWSDTWFCTGVATSWPMELPSDWSSHPSPSEDFEQMDLKESLQSDWWENIWDHFCLTVDIQTESG